MSLKYFLLSLLCSTFFLISCLPKSDDNDDFFRNNQPVTSAIFTLPSGTALNADNVTPYSFFITIDRVNGPIGFGEFTAIVNTPTGTVDVAGLAVVFDSFTQIGPNSFSVRGTVTDPFRGQGTANITLTYTEYGITILDNSATFTVTIAGPEEVSFCDLAFFEFQDSDYSPTMVVTGGPTNIADVNVLVDVTTVFTGEVSLLLTSPSGISVLLSDFDSVNTILFDDEALISISENSSSFGTFAPREPLSLFDGANANGTWTLFGEESSTGGLILNRWCLMFDGASTPTPPNLEDSSPCNSVSVPIPDGGSVSDTLFVSGFGPGFIDDLNLRDLFIDHSIASQLTITLTSPEGTVVTLSSGNGGATNAYFFITLDDRASNPVTSLSTGASSSFFPESPLSAFNGENGNGTWTLTVTDTVADSVSGVLLLWCLEFDGGGGSSR